MSSKQAFSAEWRLHLVPPRMELYRSEGGSHAPAGEALLEGPARHAQLAALTAAIRAEALPLIAVLPASVFRTMEIAWPALPGWRSRLAARWGQPPDAIAFALGPRRGLTRRIAVAHRETIDQAAAFLACSGLRPTALAAGISGAVFPAPAWPRAGRLPWLAWPGRLAATASLAAVATLLALPPRDAPSLPPAPEPTASVAAPAEQPAGIAPATADPQAALLAASPPVPRPQPLALTAKPPARPAPSPHATAVLPVVAAARMPAVMFATRNFPPVALPVPPRAEAAPTGVRVVALGDALRPAPAPRTDAAPAALSGESGLRPRSRSSNSAALAAPAHLPGRPRARPAAPRLPTLPEAITAAVELAALQPRQGIAQPVAGGVATGFARPEPRRLLPAAAPLPPRAAMAPPQPAFLAPPPPPVLPTPQAVRVRQEPVRTALPPQTVLRQQAARVAALPAAVAAPLSGAARGRMSLVGIFGTQTARHALVRLSDGSIHRVRAGDSVGGVQITAVGSDGVRLRANGRDALLKLPD